MRFLRLDLRNYGPFTDLPTIPLDGGNRGLHLIHGPNEAGKSTALRAIRTFLFGFPKSTGDNHGRDYATLRIGGAIRSESGTELSFVRRKKDVRPLWTFDDASPIDPEVLDPFLGGLDATKFDDLFAMDHAELVAGGQAILQGKGNLGSILFAAGSGLATVDQVRESIEIELDGLFKPRASNPTINAGFADLKAAREVADQAMLATSAWVELDNQIDQARRRLAEVDLEWPQIHSEKRRVERLRKALPKIAQREVVARDLDRLRSVPVLSEGFAELRRAESTALDMARKATRDADSAVESIVEELAEVGPPDSILEESEAIGQLQRDLGVYLKERGDLPIRESKLAYIEANARSRMAGLFPDRSIDDPGWLRTVAARRGLIQELAQQLGRLESGCQKAEAEVAKLIDSTLGVVDEPLSLDAPRLARSLSEAIARATAQGDLDAQLADAEADLIEFDRRSKLAIRGLSLWSGTLDELESLAIPSLATIDRFEADFRAADESIARAEASMDQAEADRLAVERDMEGVQLAGQVPTEVDLNDHRADREATWKLVRLAWLDGRPTDDPANLASAFEDRVRSADDLADRLRREADRVAAQAHRKATHRGLLTRIGILQEDRDRKRFASAEVLRDWQGLWSPLAIQPRSPREMRDWVAIDRANLLLQAVEIRSRRAKVDRLKRRVADLRDELAPSLARLGEPEGQPSESIAALLDRAKSAVARVEVALKLVVARSERSKAEVALEAWKSRWAIAVEPLGLGFDASPSRASAVLAEVDELIKATDELATLRESIGESQRLERRFEAAIGALLHRLSGAKNPSPQPSPRTGEGVFAHDVETIAIQIKVRLDRARVLQARRDDLLKREVDERAKLAKARGEVDRAEAVLATLAREARCDRLDDLPDAERASDEVKDRQAKLRELDEWLADLAETGSIDRLLAEAAGLDAETLDARIVTLDDRLTPLEAERNQLLEEMGRFRERLESMDGGPAAADAQQVVEERVARLSIDVEQYVRLRLASAVLRDAVERYRKDHQGPVLDRAGALFASLTAGSFAGLRADLDDKGEPVLLGVRGDGSTTLKVDAMSEGTADQLYLALRLASLQTYLDDHEPMPLIVDDLLVNFDNTRALAALKALAELSNRTQVLFFTHHDHLVDLARSAVDANVLFVHRLTFPPISIPAPINGHDEGLTLEAVQPKRKKKAKPTVAEDHA